MRKKATRLENENEEKGEEKMALWGKKKYQSFHEKKVNRKERKQ